MNFRLLATKFHIPTRRAGLVVRPRLLEELQCGWAEHRKLTLISAPVGYGKTTLVAEWLANFQSETKNKKSPGSPSTNPTTTLRASYTTSWRPSGRRTSR